MSRFVNPYLTSTAAAGASAIVFAAAVAPLPDLTMSAGQVTGPTGYSRQLVDLVAAAQRLAPSVAPPTSPDSGTPSDTAGDLPAAPALRALAPTAADAAAIAPLAALADVIDNTYNTVEPWLRRVVEAPKDLLGTIPVVGWLTWQPVVLYNFIESMVQSVIFNFTDVLRGEGSILDNLVDVGWDLFGAVVYVVIDEMAAANGGVPPAPVVLPRPPVDESVVSTLAADGIANNVTVDIPASARLVNAGPAAGTGTAPDADAPGADGGTESGREFPDAGDEGAAPEADTTDTVEETAEEGGTAIQDIQDISDSAADDPDLAADDEQIDDEAADTVDDLDDENTDDATGDESGQTTASETPASPGAPADQGDDTGTTDAA